MPQNQGLFGVFQEAQNISSEEIVRWLPHSLNSFYIENYFANRIFYPDAIAQTRQDQELEYAILREALIKNPDVYSAKDAKLVIPEKLILHFADISKVIWAYLDAYKPKELLRVFLQNQKLRLMGTVVVPEVAKKEGLIELVVENKKYTIKLGDLTIIPCLKSRCDINFFSKNARILGKNEQVLEIFGGNLGIVVDARGLN